MDTVCDASQSAGSQKSTLVRKKGSQSREIRVRLLESLKLPVVVDGELNVDDPLVTDCERVLRIRDTGDHEVRLKDLRERLRVRRDR